MTTEITLTDIVSGLIGALIRAVVGITKDKSFTPDKFKFQWQYFVVSLLVAAIVGITSGIIADGD